jgi:spore coat polysaccharide biosynthesis protein SpsF
MKNTVAIIQARMGSKRLPGKMLKKINNFSIMEWVFLRVLQSKRINKIILATTNLKRDDPLVKIAKKHKIHFFRGSEKDVLGRFFKAATRAKAKNIIRICADCALIDSQELDKLVKIFYSKNCEYVCNHENKLNSKYADGFGAEMFSYKVLSKLNKIANKKSDREHVTTFIWKNLSKFKIFAIPAPKSLSYPNLKFFINTKRDFTKIKNLIVNNNINFKTKGEIVIKYYLKELKK